ncbi:MAG: response regulator [Limisphaerales bacterium]
MSIRLLTVDDCEITRQTVVNALKKYDCTILEACDGAAGLAVASHEKPDVILLDHKMPVMNGTEALAQLRAKPDLAGIPVIMLTADSSRESVLHLAKLGVRDYLLKPIQEGTLVERLRHFVPLKAKSETEIKVKHINDPIQVLVVDDMPAIVKQISAGMSGTAWNVTAAGRAEQALALCLSQEVDVVLASLALPKDGAYTLLHKLRDYAAIAALPVFALSVKTAVQAQAHARAAGFCGVITKPIDCAQLRAKVCRTLKLETSYKYFQQRDGALVLTLPKEFQPEMAPEVSATLDDQLAATVNAGGDKFIVDLTALPSAPLPVIELLLSAVRNCAELSLKYAMAGSDSIRKECQGHEKAKDWLFAGDFAQALALLQ